MEASSSNIGAWVAFGIAGAGLVATGVLTGLTVQSEAELNDICSNRVCPPKVTDKVESYETMKAATFGAAAATGAATLTLAAAAAAAAAPGSATRRSRRG